MTTTKKTSAQRMREFADTLNWLYHEAEALRDHAGGSDKEIFNHIRRALYDLTDPARYQANRWEAGNYD